MSLEDWLRNRWLVAHTPGREEVENLLAIAARDLEDAKADGLSDDWRHNIAYNAALQLATAVLAAEGYRAARDK